ncbi:hypothetical protein ND861_18930 [Leptospira sp. 2 VSF19]|uniref:DUF4145 domain-containing protein n=1 Tax=Leptospira soteropolitanensis TaxID=2950025 RepID=A0AAW5VIG6_9LEPT|nr:hypothetical protein [Leptospira soteropolitanensis]MCW7494741.1 hypothetical protein [Leptospira soteropolitanensis]MCW7502343.1 hypothetical protein [Leptospira soteropolitanensis]MCW7524570.1 hypothetical protein [Leptospira soteropolitanensis]MCW7528440.1 hypothetical protein [Leptospira soteropolitanensis]MCW7532310.1 hypothetical protein [Leptospira soteropolitanensis]
MEIAKLILELISVLIWPIITLIIFFNFKNEFKNILRKITKATLPGGVEIDIDQNIRESKELIPLAIKERKTHLQKNIPRTKQKQIEKNELHSKIHKNFGLKDPSSNLKIVYYQKIAKSDPILSLASIRIDLEIMIKNIAKRYSIIIKQNDSPNKIAQSLLENYKITSNQYNMIKQLLKICNAGLHGQEVSNEQIEEIIEITKILIDDYKSWLDWGFANT